LSKRSPRKLITYGTRGLEPMRGFSYFIKELLEFLPNYPDVEVEIAGEDKVFYSSSRAPQGYASWGSWAQQELSALELMHRVQFVKRLPPRQYRSWLRQSDLHVYLTQPFVLSWSLLEALSTCRFVGASDVQPVKELFSSRSPLLFDHRKPGWLQRTWSLISESPVADFNFGSPIYSRFGARESIIRWHSLVRQLTHI